MKSLFHISDDEKLRILEMHSSKKVMTEQRLEPRAVELVKRGDTVNLYTDDKMATEPDRYHIEKVMQDENGIIRLRVHTSVAGRGKETLALTFKCNEGFFNAGETTDAEGVKTITKYYSTDFSNKVRSQFCQKNQSGHWVPKAKFASIGTVSPEPMV